MPLGGAGGGAGAAIKAGRAFVEVTADDSGLKSVFASVKKNTLGLSKTLAGAGAGLIGIGGTVLGPISAAFHSAVGEITEMRKAAEQLGTTPEVFSKLAFAAKKFGVDSEGLVLAGKKFQGFLVDAAEGGGAAKTLQEIGLAAKDLVGLPLDEQFKKIADGIQRVGSVEKQNALTREIFGRGGAALAPLVRQGGAGLDEQFGQADKFGKVISSADAADAKTFTKAIGEAKLAVDSLWKALGSSLLIIADPIKQASELFVNVVLAVRKWADENRPLVATIAGVAAAVVAAGSALVGIGSALAIATFAVGGFMTALSAVGTVIGAIFTPTGLVIIAVAAAVAGLTYALFKFTNAGELVSANFNVLFGGMADTLATTFGGIRDAFKAGNLELAWKIGVAGLNVIWRRFVFGITVIWNSLKDVFVDSFEDIVTELQVAIAKLFASLPKSLKFGLEVNTEEEIRRIREEDKVARHQIRQGAIEQQGQRVREARDELARLRKEAADGVPVGKVGPPVSPSAAAITSALAVAVKGSFSAFSAREVFGLGNAIESEKDILKEQLEVQKGIKAGVDKFEAGMEAD